MDKNKFFNKKNIIILSFILIVVFSFCLYLYFKMPDIIISNVTSDNDQFTCKYNIEIINKGFLTIDSTILKSYIAYCLWPEGEQKCRFAWDVINRNPETGKVTPLVLEWGKKYKFTTVGIPVQKFWR